MLTRFEKARIISARALQIAQGAPVLVKVPKDMKRIEDIIDLEFEKGALPLTVVREMPDGKKMFLDMKGEEIGKAEK
jgi:DNA-directed RNA polymerase subunit K/omega